MVSNDKHFTHTYFAIISHISLRHMKIKNLQSILSLKIFLMENECKTPIGCHTLFSIKNIFYDKIDLRSFYFRVKIEETR